MSPLNIANNISLSLQYQSQGNGLTCFLHSRRWIAKCEILSWIFECDLSTVSPLWLLDISKIRKTRVRPSAYTSNPTFTIFMPVTSPLLILWSPELDANPLCCHCLWKDFHARTLSKLISRNGRLPTRKTRLSSYANLLLQSKLRCNYWTWIWL